MGSQASSLVVDPQGRLLVGWITHNAPNGDASLPEPVAFSRSLDGGQSWSPAVLMDFLRLVSSRNQADPWLALDGLGRIYFARLEYSSLNSSDPQSIVVSRSDDAGTTWKAPVGAIQTKGEILDKDSIAGDGAGAIYAASSDFAAPSTQRVLVTRSSDGGAAWSAPVNASGNPTTFGFGVVMVARPGGEVHTLWTDEANDMITHRSFNGGQTWSAGVRVNDVPGSSGGVSSLAMNSKGSLFAAWLDARNSSADTLVVDIFTARSDDGRLTWSRAVQINDDHSLQFHGQPSLAVDGNDVVHAAWVDYRTGNYNIYYSNSKDGRHWSANERVTDAETNPATVPKGVRLGDYIGLAADRVGNLFAAWTDGRNGHTDIYFARRPVN